MYPEQPPLERRGLVVERDTGQGTYCFVVAIDRCPAVAITAIVIGAFVPFVGALLSGLVAVLVAFADGGWKVGLAASRSWLPSSSSRGTPPADLQGRTVDLHPAVILLAVAAGASLFDIVGAYLAVPVTAVVFAVVGSLRADWTAPRGALATTRSARPVGRCTRRASRPAQLTRV